MKWIKDNWPVVLFIGLVLAAIIVFLISRVKMSDYRGEIKAKDNLIEQMMVEYQTLEDSARETKKQAKFNKLAVLGYRDSLQNTRLTLINQNKQYVKALADLNRIPTDSLYVDVTEWLDSLSIQW